MAYFLLWFHAILLIVLCMSIPAIEGMTHLHFLATLYAAIASGFFAGLYIGDNRIDY